MGQCNKCYDRGLISIQKSRKRHGFQDNELKYCSCKAGKKLKEKHNKIEDETEGSTTEKDGE